MSFKKFDGSAWQSITPKKLKGIPYRGTLPATLTGTKAGYLHKYKIYGNTVQTGTPTPENPIEPSECGEKTANLLDEEHYEGTGWLYSSGAIAPSTNYYISKLIPVTDGVWLSFINSVYPDIPDTSMRIAFYDSDKTIISSSFRERTNITATFSEFFQKPSNGAYFRYNGRITNNSVMVNTGSTALSYEPYGYKLPLTSAGQDVDIYLGESQTTRRIKKLVFDGTENWGSAYTDNNMFFHTSLSGVYNSNSFMSHFVQARIGSTTTETGYLILSNNGDLRVRPNNPSAMGLAGFKQFLAAQYANGTPVTVWYVLATEETGTLNEPLRKIGDYADTIDSTQTSAQIPTSAGSTTISWAGEGLAPSEFDSVQEWVDIPTYKRVNGEWVEDN